MPVSVFDMQSLQHLWGTEELRSLFSEENRVQKWLDCEAALAAAQAELGIIPEAAAREIGEQARIENVDIAAMSAEIRRIKHSLVPALLIHLLRLLPVLMSGDVVSDSEF